MDRSDRFTFGPFCFDLRGGHLWQGDRDVPLRPRTFAVLRYLAERPHQLVSADDLYQHVWQGAHVSRSTLRVSIREIRAALGDSAQAPQYLETVPGRGYRFIGRLAVQMSSAGSAAYADASASMVGRQQEFAKLGQWIGQALGGQRQLVVISGDAGIGKTMLVDTFLAQYCGDSGLRIGRGQCIEHYGEGEAYLPVLEALGRLGRAPGGEEVLAVLRQVAPSWLMHLPALISEAERQQLQGQGTTREQMLRELGEALEALSVDTPLVLVLEDLHWSDPSTVEVLASVARRREAAKLLIIGTYRPTEAQLQIPPLVACLQELRVHGQAVELALAGLDVEEVAAYGLRGLGAPLTSEATAFLHRRSAGNAFFLVHLVEHLLQEGNLVSVEGFWTLRDTAAAWQRLPEKVHLLLARLGQSDDAIACMRQGIEAYRHLTILGLARYLAQLAEVCGCVGALDQGLAVIAEALTLVERTGEQVDVAEIHRLQGELLRARSHADVAEAASCFQHALAVARAQQSKSLELRTATSLARLWQQQGKRKEGYELLAPLCAWFTEGSDTADLRAANGLLEELAG